MRPRASARRLLWLSCALLLAAAAAPRGQVRAEIFITSIPVGAAVLGAEDARAPTAQEFAALLEGARSTIPEIKVAAIRAIGRLERRESTPVLLPLLGSAHEDVWPDAAEALAQSMQGERLQLDTGGQHVEGILMALLSLAAAERSPGGVVRIGQSLARLPYERSTQVGRAEAMLVSILQLSKGLLLRLDEPREARGVIAGAALALELMARRQRTLFRPAETTIEALRPLAAGTARHASGPVREAAFSALLVLGGLDADTLEASLPVSGSPDVARLAMLALAGAGSPITGSDRAHYIKEAFTDPDYTVRYEAVRAYARHVAATEGCVPLVQMLADPSEHVVLGTLDLLGDACPGDEDVLERLIAEAGTPTDLEWRRQSHALVALAKRSPAHAAVPLASHSRHNLWQVRMYAARAAVAAKDADTLSRLALDHHDNVREATLAALRRLRPDSAEQYFFAALSRNDYQLLRTAARESGDLPMTLAFSDTLVDALLRVTAQKRETSRDTRMALLERLRSADGRRYVERLRPLLKDFDRKIATEVASMLGTWTGQVYLPEPQALPRQALPSPSELQILRDHVAVLVMEKGPEISISFDYKVAPLTSVRFLRLANANYFDGLTFHRIVTNFVVQGGSPGANEYMGDGPFVRDEISSLTHGPATVGLSTRGRDTGDAQFFINLVHNTRLDFDYTVFGNAVPLERVREIQEGDRIAKVVFRRVAR